MLITRTSMLTNTTRTRDIPCTEEQYNAWLDGTLIQDAMPDFSPDDREFIKTGILAEEWDEAFPEDDEGE